MTFSAGSAFLYGMESLGAAAGGQVPAAIEGPHGARLARRGAMRFLTKVFLAFLLADVLVFAWVARNPSARAIVRYRAPAKTWIVPVAGVRPEDLRSSWQAPRSGGRKHRGIDIFAEKGTPVVAATDGLVMRVGTDRLGGNVVWMLGQGLQVHYYAHLDSFADGLEAGQHVRAGDVLGTVGNTGNARTTPSHLHFALSHASFSRRTRTAYDPTPVLREARTIPADQLVPSGHTSPTIRSRAVGASSRTM